MKLYQITLVPQGLFATPLVGDTLFGHLCWQFADDPALLSCDFSQAIADYRSRPFCIVSSAFPKVGDGFAMPRPDLGLFGRPQLIERSERRQFLEQRKTLKKQKWLLVEGDLQLKFDKTRLLDEATLAAVLFQGMDAEGQQLAQRCTGDFIKQGEEMHNSINRLTGTTGEGFDPYAAPSRSIFPGARLVLFILADPALCPPEALQTALTRIGSFGYGRDASSGKGRFAVEKLMEKPLRQAKESNALCTLAPCVPDEAQLAAVSRSWFTPLTRFGRHGGGAQLQGNPFKSPVIMADTAAVFQTTTDSPWLGRGIGGVSKVIEQTVVQGYAPCLPCTVEV